MYQFASFIRKDRYTHCFHFFDNFVDENERDDDSEDFLGEAGDVFDEKAAF